MTTNNNEEFKLKTNEDLIKEINRLLTEESPKDKDCISLYDVFILINKYRNKFEKIKENSEEQLKNTLRKKYDGALVVIHSVSLVDHNKLSFGFLCEGDK